LGLAPAFFHIPNRTATSRNPVGRFFLTFQIIGNLFIMQFFSGLIKRCPHLRLSAPVSSTKQKKRP